VIKQIIRKIFFFALKTAVVLSVILALFIGWIYTGSRTIPFLAGYLTKEISSIMPEGSTFSLEKVVLGFDEDNSIALKLINAKLHNDKRGDFELAELKAKVDLLGLMPQSNHNLLNIQISQPKIQLMQLIYDGEADENGPLPIEKINSYIEKYHDKLLKFSLLLSNTQFGFDISPEESLDIQVNTLVLSPHIHNKKMVFVLYGDINIRDKNSIVDITFDTTSNKYLNVKGTVNNISTSLFEEIGFKIDELKGSHVEADVTFDARVTNTKTIEQIEFNIGNFEGKINKNHFFPVDITPDYVSIKGHCFANCSEIEVEHFKMKADYLDLDSSFTLKRINGQLTLQGAFVLNSLPVNHVQDYWPIPITARTRQWIFEHISEGNLTKADGRFNLNLDEIRTKKKINKKDILINLKLDGTSIAYMEGVPPVNSVHAKVIITGEDVSFKVDSATIHNSKILKAEGIIPDLVSSKSRVEVKAEVGGGLQELVDIAFAHAEVKNDKYKNMQGTAHTNVDVVVPIQDEDLTLKDINLYVTSKITNAIAPNIYKNYTAKNGTLNATYKNHVATVVGTATMNEKFPVDINANLNFLANVQKITVKTKLNWDDIVKLGYPKPEYFNNGFTAGIELYEDDKGSKETIDLDLTNSTVYIKKIGIKKKIGEPSHVRFSMNEKADHVEIPSYDISFGNFSSTGQSKLSKNLKDIIFINSENTKLGKSSFSFSYKPADNKDVLNIVGDSLDLSNVSFGGSSEGEPASKAVKDTRGIVLYAKVHKLYMKNDMILDKPNLEVDCSNTRCNKIQLAGNFDGGAYVKLDMNYPNLKMNSNNAGQAIKAIGISEKVGNGILDLSGNFKDDTFSGVLNINNFQLVKAPVLAKLLSVVSITVTSFEGISNLISNSGVKFEKLVCPMDYKDGVIKITDCAAKGNTLALTANGTVDIKADKIDIKGVVVPENIVNQVLKNVPILKDIFGNKTENEAIGANFTVTGSTDDPDVKSNPLSLLTPGFLRNIFNKF
jgi:hypothetical protein